MKARAVKKRAPGAGRKKLLRACAYCGDDFGAREMVAHVPGCMEFHGGKTLARRLAAQGRAVVAPPVRPDPVKSFREEVGKFEYEEGKPLTWKK